MNVKRSLESRVRGWFPAEPYLVSTTRVKVAYVTRQKSLIIPPDYTWSATKYAVVIAAIWIICFSYPLLSASNFGFNLSAFQIAVWVFAGLTFGGLSGVACTKNQLHRLSKDHKISVTAKDMMLLSIPMLLFMVSVYLATWLLLSGSVRGGVLGGFLFAVYFWGVSLYVPRIFLFRSYERKANMRLMQSWGDSGIAEIPKPPNRSGYNSPGKLPARG